jgi:hypothetical protein
MEHAHGLPAGKGRFVQWAKRRATTGASLVIK